MNSSEVNGNSSIAYQIFKLAAAYPNFFRNFDQNSAAVWTSYIKKYDADVIEHVVDYWILNSSEAPTINVLVRELDGIQRKKKQHPENWRR